MLSNALLQIQKLSPKYALGSKRKVKALEQVFLFINKGETLGSVEKSGSGKSTLARIIRGAEKALMIFQDSYASLDSRMMMKDSVVENLFYTG